MCMLLSEAACTKWGKAKLSNCIVCNFWSLTYNSLKKIEHNIWPPCTFPILWPCVSLILTSHSSQTFQLWELQPHWQSPWGPEKIVKVSFINDICYFLFFTTWLSMPGRCSSLFCFGIDSCFLLGSMNKTWLNVRLMRNLEKVTSGCQTLVENNVSESWAKCYDSFSKNTFFCSTCRLL